MTHAPHLDYLMIFAHPDDESFGLGGLLSWARDSGVRFGLVCATRGDAGKISDPSLGTPDTLGAVRERELRLAMTQAGISELRILSYRDSGMAGTTENQDPRSLSQAPYDSVLSDLVFQIRDLKPRAVITFGPDGVYGHPDHVRIGAIADQAVAVAATEDMGYLGDSWQVDRLYHSAVAREDFMVWAKNPTGPFANMTHEQIQQLGIPRAEITHFFDVLPYVDSKLAILRRHATQLPHQPEPNSPSDPASRPNISRESLKRIGLPWNTPSDPPDALDRVHSPELASRLLNGPTPQ